jgi:hypothetical protein
MNALAQGAAGVALVMSFALLRTRQISGAALLLAVQSGAVAIPAMVLHRPLMAVPGIAAVIAMWLVWRQPASMLSARAAPETPANSSPVGGARTGIALGAVLAVVCQSQGDLGVPLAIMLLAILLAAIRRHRLMQVMALVAAQNGIALAGCIAGPPTAWLDALAFPVGCVLLPLPLAAWLLRPRRLNKAMMWTTDAWIGWTDLALAAALFAATLLVPLDSLGAVFAPLLGLDGVMKALVRRNRIGLTPPIRCAALLQTAFMILSVSAPTMETASLPVLGAATMALLPMLPRRWDAAVLGFLGAGLSLVGAFLLPVTPSLIVWFSLFAGFAVIAAVVPELAPVLAVLILRLATLSPWPPGAEPLAIAVALGGLLVSAFLLVAAPRPHRTTLLVLSQSSLAVLAIGIGGPDGRFAALVLLILLFLTRSATRKTDGPAATLARAGLGGILPLGVFPGLILVILAVSAGDPVLLLPLGTALIGIGMACIPRRAPDLSLKALRSLAWAPLALALFAGYLAPSGLVEWLRVIAAGRP